MLDAGLKPVVPEGGYFLLADISKIAKNFNTDENECKDSKFIKFLIKDNPFQRQLFLVKSINILEKILFVFVFLKMTVL